MRGRRILACLLAGLLLGGAAQARQATEAAPATAPAAATAAVTTPAPAASVAPPARPAPSAVTPAAPASFAAGAAGSLVQTILALCLVLGLLALLAWALKRYGPKASGNSAHVRMVGGLNLGGRERIIVVEVGEQWIVVGASPGRVNALATMPRQAAGAAGQLPAQLHPQQAGASSFAEWLKQTIDKRNGNRDIRPNGDNGNNGL